MMKIANSSSLGAVDVLIVDDRIDGIIALEAILKAPNINLIRAQSGKEALNLLPQHDFAVILLDVQMPEMDGFETAHFIRKTERYNSTPIIFVTAINKDDRYIHKGYEAGCVDYIFKPIEPTIIQSKVAVFVDLFKKNRQLEQQSEIIRESERRERYLRLAELEVENLKRYRNLADAIPHLVWKARTDGTFDYFNKGWALYTGLSSDQSTGNGWHAVIHPDDLNDFLKTWMKSMHTHTDFQAECRIKRYDGEMRWHWVRAVPEVRSRELISWIGTCTDIHDRKQADVKMREAEKLAVAANAAKTNFLANVSHEIRTPLGSILGFTELLLDPTQTEEDRLQSVSTISRSGKQLLRIIDEILDVSKVEAGHLAVEKIPVNVLAILEETMSVLGVQVQNKDLRLKLKFKTKIPEQIYSDPTRIRQILINVVGNAIKFTPRGQIFVEALWIESLTDPPCIQFRVTDTGIGIRPEIVEKLFQPFVQSDTSTTRQFGGTGLGLSLARQLAKALRGNVYLEKSEYGNGSTFVIQVEAELVRGTKFVNEFAPKKEESDKVVPLNQSEALKGMNILLVDDALDNQLLISRYLTLAGADVDLAANGQEGLDKALKGSYELILMDIQMPHLDGYEAASQLRVKGYKRPIIALTAHALKEERDRCLKVGFNEHLTKPVNRKALIEQIVKIVNT